MSRYQKPALLNINADDAWAAACQAQRLNQGYIKNVEFVRRCPPKST